MSKEQNSLFLFFGQNQEAVRIIDNNRSSRTIGIGSESCDENFGIFDAGRELLSFEQTEQVSFNLLEKIKAYSSEYFEQLTRWAFSDYSFIDPFIMHQQYASSVNYWYNFLKNKNISRILCYEDPHRAFDMILYALARELKIPFYIFTELTTGYRTYVKDSIEANLETVPGVFEGSDRQANLSLKYNHISSQFVKTSKLKSRLRLASKFYKFWKLFKKNDSYIFTNGMGYAQISFIKYKFWLWKAHLKTILIRHHHKKISSVVKYREQDIVFYLHYQPERTSNPLGGEARNQIHCLKLLKNAYPNRRVFVKEHPSQLNLNNTHQNRQFRSKQYYSLINQISDGLVQNAPDNDNFIAATIHGTVGLELALRGKVVLCFGNPWYSFLDNVFRIRSTEDLIKINLDKNYDQSMIESSLNEMLYSKSARGSISNKLEKTITHESQNYKPDNREFMNYLNWYFNINGQS